jgi:hypothetical protein
LNIGWAGADVSRELVMSKDMSLLIGTNGQKCDVTRMKLIKPPVTVYLLVCCLLLFLIRNKVKCSDVNPLLDNSEVGHYKFSILTLINDSIKPDYTLHYFLCLKVVLLFLNESP